MSARRTARSSVIGRLPKARDTHTASDVTGLRQCILMVSKGGTHFVIGVRKTVPPAAMNEEEKAHSGPRTLFSSFPTTSPHMSLDLSLTEQAFPSSLSDPSGDVKSNAENRASIGSHIEKVLDRVKDEQVRHLFPPSSFGLSGWSSHSYSART